MTGKVGSHPDGGAQASICAYRPQGVSERAGAFARAVVSGAAPSSEARTKALLFAASRLGAFGESVGLELEAGVLLHPAVIERFIVAGERTFSAPTRRTLRTNLRSLARAVAAHPQPTPVALGRERAKPPYSAHELELFLASAKALSTPCRRMRAQALICLGAGAGLLGSELRHIRGADVSERCGGLVVEVGGPRARIVPVLARFHEPLLASAAFAGQGYLLGARNPDRKNLTCQLAALFCDRSLSRLDTGRLRSTWLHQAAQAIGLGAFMAAAGVSCSQRLGDIAASLPVLSETEMLTLLGGSP